MTVVGGANDPGYVARQYATEAGLAARKAAHASATGPDARDVAFAAVCEVDPRDVLEVGCGEGELAERVAAVPGVRVIAVDQSPRMVEITAARGVEAMVGDVQQLPFTDASFDVALAAWMLYHAPDLPGAIAELARVLRPGGRLVAVTNASDHLSELFALGGVDRFELPFRADNAEELLLASFAAVERRDAPGTSTFADIDAVRAYFNSTERLAAHVDRLPARLDGPLVARRRPVVFVATKR